MSPQTPELMNPAKIQWHQLPFLWQSTGYSSGKLSRARQPCWLRHPLSQTVSGGDLLIQHLGTQCSVESCLWPGGGLGLAGGAQEAQTNLVTFYETALHAQMLSTRVPDATLGASRPGEHLPSRNIIAWHAMAKLRCADLPLDC